MRRTQSEIKDQQQIKNILTKATIGRMATIGDNGFPYITPVNFVYHNDKIYFHCAHEGEKLDNINRNNKVCFEVDIPLAYMEVAFNRMNKACKVHQLYKCVIIRGRAKVVDDTETKIDALNALVASHEGNRNFDPVTPEDPMAKACSVVEITPESISGKADLIQKAPEEDRRKIATDLAARGQPGDLEAVKAMGFELAGGPDEGWSLKD
jgi:nitroimidazol reductase NimA-like FMN-containing flavoprotein (pyridoxamine 5'-phosphate oxidase superfamily)